MNVSMLPEIPRLVTALSEWCACLILIIPLGKRFSGKITLLILAAAFLIQHVFQVFAGNLELKYWILGMCLNVIFMFSYIWLCCEIRLTIANSNAMNGIGTETELESHIPAWKFWLVLVNVFVLAFAYLWFWFTKKLWEIRPRKVKKAERAAKKEERNSYNTSFGRRTDR